MCNVKRVAQNIYSQSVSCWTKLSSYLRTSYLERIHILFLQADIEIRPARFLLLLRFFSPSLFQVQEFKIVFYCWWWATFAHWLWLKKKKKILLEQNRGLLAEQLFVNQLATCSFVSLSKENNTECSEKITPNVDSPSSLLSIPLCLSVCLLEVCTPRCCWNQIPPWESPPNCCLPAGMRVWEAENNQSHTVSPPTQTPTSPSTSTAVGPKMEIIVRLVSAL